MVVILLSISFAVLIFLKRPTKKHTIPPKEVFDVLDKIMIAYTQGKYEKFSAFTIVSLFSNGRISWLNNDNAKADAKSIQIILKALEESGDLERSGDGYKVMPKAFLTISKYRLSNDKHNDQVAHNRSIKYLTYAVLLVAFGQLSLRGYSYYQSLHQVNQVNLVNLVNLVNQ